MREGWEYKKLGDVCQVVTSMEHGAHVLHLRRIKR